MMESRRNKAIDILFLALGAFIILASLASWQLIGAIDPEWAVTSSVIGAIVALFGVVGLLRKDRPRGDERTRKLSGYAASWSWFSAVVVTSVLYLLDNRGIISLSASGALAAVLVTLLATFVAFNAYYRSRGDVE